MKKIIIIGLLLITTGTIAPKLIEIGPLPENTIVDEETGLKAADGKFYLETDVEDYIFADTYNNFIAAQQAKDLPYIIAITTTKIADDKFLYSASDAHGLNKFLFEGGDPARPYFWNRYNAQDLQQKQFNDYKRRPIINRISYYLIDTIDDTAATLLGTDYDLLQADPNKKRFMRNFFKANLNDADAQYSLANLFGNADSYEQTLLEGKNNIEELLRYNKLAADKGHADAQVEEGNTYEQDENFDEAERYYKLAADQNHAEGQYRLGNLYIEKGDLKLAKQYLTLSADQRHEKAQTDLGIMLEQEENFDEAERYFKLAADQENSEAQYRLGNLFYLKGNLDQAKHYLKEAGFGSAHYLLATIFEKEFNLGLAKKHHYEAAKDGGTDAQRNLESALKRINAKIALIQEQEEAQPSTSAKRPRLE